MALIARACSMPMFTCYPAQKSWCLPCSRVEGHAHVQALLPTHPPPQASDILDWASPSPSACSSACGAPQEAGQALPCAATSASH